MKTNELIGVALDLMVSKCDGRETWHDCCQILLVGDDEPYKPSTDWAQGGPIIEREGIKLYRGQTGAWWSATESDPHHPVSGPTPLVAAMRCYVIGILGDEVEVPEGEVPEELT